jgi:hypothetical protein
MFNLATIYLVFLMVFPIPGNLSVPKTNGDITEDVHSLAEEYCKNIFCEAGLEGKLDYEIYRRAFNGITALSATKKDILTIIDFSKPSSERRLYIIDLKNHKLLYQTLVAHGKNSGAKECQHFSNRPQSLQSSPGFYLTAETYSGRHGYSLRLDGLEPGINDMARSRAIVMHGADYVCQEYVEEYGYIGRSFGCPAVPDELNQDIIDLIKGGSCLYIHTNDVNYISKTTIRN